MSDVQHYITRHEWHRKCANSPKLLLDRVVKYQGKYTNENLVCPICGKIQGVAFTIKRKKLKCLACEYHFNFLEVYNQLYKTELDSSQIMNVLKYKESKAITKRITVTISDVNLKYLQEYSQAVNMTLSKFVNALVDKSRLYNYRKK